MNKELKIILIILGSICLWLDFEEIFLQMDIEFWMMLKFVVVLILFFVLSRVLTNSESPGLLKH